MHRYLSILLITLSLSSCIVQSPKYAGVEKVLTLKTGMTKDQISETLGVAPYDLKLFTDSTTVYIYKYRTTERRTFPFYTKETNGVRTRGKFVDLFVTCNRNGVATEIRSCSECGETKIREKRIDYNALLQFIAATAPGVLIYFGLKAN